MVPQSFSNDIIITILFWIIYIIQVTRILNNTYARGFFYRSPIKIVYPYTIFLEQRYI